MGRFSQTFDDSMVNDYHLVSNAIKNARRCCPVQRRIQQQVAGPLTLRAILDDLWIRRETQCKFLLHLPRISWSYQITLKYQLKRDLWPYEIVDHWYKLKDFYYRSWPKIGKLFNKLLDLYLYNYIALCISLSISRQISFICITSI